MSLRKVAALLAAFGLMLGLISSGVGAAFTDQLTATENINVGTFECKIVAATPGAASDGIAVDGKSLTFAAPEIMSSAAGSAPFSFTVQNTGSINQQLTISVGGPYGSLTNKFSAVPLAPASPVALAAGATQTFNTGIQWTELANVDLDTSGSFVWTVSCGEPPVTTTVTSSNLNYSGTGWGGWSCPAPTPNIWSASYTGPGVLNVTLWQPGASVPGFTYPTTPFGYVYGAGEEGAIAQATGTGGTYQLILECY